MVRAMEMVKLPVRKRSGWELEAVSINSIWSSARLILLERFPMIE